LFFYASKGFVFSKKRHGVLPRGFTAVAHQRRQGQPVWHFSAMCGEWKNFGRASCGVWSARM